MKMRLLILAAVLVLTQPTANGLHEGKESSVYQCLKADSMKCTIQVVEAPDASVEVLLPDLSNKTTLQIKRGHIAYFDEKLSKQLGTVEKLQLVKLKILQLYLRPSLVEVNAMGNSIELVKFKEGETYSTQNLDLSDNKITNISGFETLTNLRVLNLASNRIENVDMGVFSTMTQLEKLDLSNNRISTVVAPQRVTLPHLESLSLARNHLIKLAVSNWQFDSLIHFDIQENDLVSIEQLHDHFGSLQSIFMSQNSWHCVWLQETLATFEKAFVSVEDTDVDCDGLTRANICCVMEQSTTDTYEENFEKLKNLEKQYNQLQQTMNDQLEQLQRNITETVSNLQRQLEEVAVEDEMSTAATLMESVDGKEFADVKSKVKSISSKVEEEISKIIKQNTEIQKVHRKLGYTIIELRIALERETKKIFELQSQFGLLKEYVRSKLDKRTTSDD